MIGVVLALHIATVHSGPLRAVAEVSAVAHHGLEGDRHFLPPGGGRTGPRSSCDVTLIEVEALDALAREHHIALSPAQSRRNILTRGIRLDALVGAQVDVGPVRLRGVKLSQPCAHLERLTALPGVVRGLVHRAGLRTEIVTGGLIRVGDRIEPTISDDARGAGAASGPPA